jgi:hypothetical protein
VQGRSREHFLYRREEMNRVFGADSASHRFYPRGPGAPSIIQFPPKATNSYRQSATRTALF